MGFNLKKILRALLFSTSDPLTIKDIQAVVSRYHSELENSKKSSTHSEGENKEIDGDCSNSETTTQSEIEDIMSQVPTLLTATQIREAMEEIAGELEESGDVCRLIQSAAGFKLAISKDYADWVRLLRNDPRPQKLTRAALETLAIIAYRQPVTRAEIEAIRGVNADSAISRLTEKELIFISGRADLPGRPIQFSTTSNFLDYIGVNSIEELPASDVLSPNQISEWIRRASSPTEIKEKDVGLPDNNAEHNIREVAVDSVASSLGDVEDNAQSTLSENEFVEDVNDSETTVDSASKDAFTSSLEDENQ